ncbi:hypothetical protein [Treponema sp.]|uniref:hypothetical protein n=1 Tax=Treponema sp. TaxID=166 RepID=UPI003F0B0344
MHTATALETKLILLLSATPDISQNELTAHFENECQAKKAIEGCLAKKFIVTTKKQKYALTPEGKKQI